jgi:hypothetical protein
VVTAPLAVIALMAMAAPTGAAEASPSAFVAKIDVEVAGTPTTNVGPLAYADKSKPEASVAKVSVPNILTAGLSSSKVEVDQATGAQTVTATLAEIKAGLRRPAASGLNVGTLTTTCTATPGGSPAGKVEIVSAQLGAVKLPETPAPNTKLDIPGAVPGGPALGTLVLNEQVPNSDGSLTVRAAHLSIAQGPLGTTEAILGSATCGNTVQPERRA